MSAKDDESPFFCFFFGQLFYTAQAVPLVCRVVNVAWCFFVFFSQKRNHLDPAASGAGKPREIYLQ